ncbi:MAG: hypothetical protein K0S47_3403 [Herbinix sp.]|jgi:predicted transcriptional regulator YdeE|nr:hypothetical protein [Herbinix sp.]
MNTAEKLNVDNEGESYSPKRKPEILHMAEYLKKSFVASETLVTALNDDCSIVDRAEMTIVGVRIEYRPSSSLDIIQTAQRYMKDGTCQLLETLVGNKTPGNYIAVMADVKTGIEFTYIVGVEVNNIDHLPEALPPNTVIFTCPAGRYGKRTKRSDENAKNTVSSFSYTDFRESSGYVYNKNLFPYHFFDEKGELLSAYEPVKIPATEEERYDSISWEIVTLPSINAIGCVGEGIQCMFDLFDIENTIDWDVAGALNMNQYVSFGFQTDDGVPGFMGRQVANLNSVPEKLTGITLPSRLYVHFYQMQVNNDNPSIFYEGAKDVLFFQKHPEYEPDYSTGFYDLIISQYEQGSSVYIPIKKKEA